MQNTAATYAKNCNSLLSLSNECLSTTSPPVSRRRKLTNERVQHGVWRKDSNGPKIDVTLKATPLPGADGEVDDASRAKLLQEVVIMRQFRHPNIPRLYGVVDEDRVSGSSHYTCCSG